MIVSNEQLLNTLYSTELYQELSIIMLVLTQLMCALDHDMCHALQIVEYNQTKLHSHVINQIIVYS